jgi:hypothetical protein
MTVDLADPIAVLLTATRAFEQARIEAAAYGGLVVAMYGRARETKDADVAVSTADIGAAYDALIATGLSVVRAFTDITFGGSTVSRLTLLGGGELNTVGLVRPRSARYAADVMRSVPRSARSRRRSPTTMSAVGLRSSSCSARCVHLHRGRCRDNRPEMPRVSMTSLSTHVRIRQLSWR